MEMKYIAVLVVLIVMGYTWSLATTERAFSVGQYKQVEAGVEKDIRSFIQRKYPETKAIACSQLYTEAVEPGVEMLAHFRCSAATDPQAEEVTEQIFEGYLRLRSTDGFQTWGETGGEILSPEVRFLKGVHITPEGKGATEPAKQAPAESHSHE